MKTKRTQLNAKMIVAYQAGEHRLLHDGCLVIENSQIIHVGKSYDGQSMR